MEYKFKSPKFGRYMKYMQKIEDESKANAMKLAPKDAEGNIDLNFYQKIVSDFNSVPLYIMMVLVDKDDNHLFESDELTKFESFLDDLELNQGSELFERGSKFVVEFIASLQESPKKKKVANLPT